MSILPIVTYNDAVLRKKGERIQENSAELQTLIDDMFETMVQARGVGLAAPQIGKSLQLFVMNADPMFEPSDEDERLGDLVMINPVITQQSGPKLPLEEGCLSIPDVREKVFRPTTITISFLSRTFEPQTLTLEGMNARVAQHEYDHLQGILFVDYLGSFRKRIIQHHLNQIERGEIEAEYPLFPKMG